MLANPANRILGCIYILTSFYLNRVYLLVATRPWQPVQLLAAIPLPVRHALETPSKVAQLAMLEPRGAGRLMGTADEVEWTVHFHRNLLPIIQSHERVDAISGGLATMLFLDMDTVRADFSYHVGLQLRRLPFSRDESVVARLL